MSGWKTLVFAVAALALGTYIYLVERPKMAAEGEQDLLIRFDVETVVGLTLAYPNEEPIVLRRDEDGWSLTAPVAAGADDPTVERLLQQIADAKAERRIADSEAQDLATYGLDGDGQRARLSLTLEDGTRLPDIIVGRTTPVGYEAFARLDDSSEIVVTPLIFHTGVKKSVFELRDKQLFSFDQQAVIGIEVDSSELAVRLERQGDAWQVSAPISDKADQNQVQTWISSLSNLQALAFYEGDDIDREAFGLDSPALQVDVELGGGEFTGFRLGSRIAETPAGYYFERKPDGLVAKVPEWLGVRFATELSALRDKHLFDCDPNEIVRMSFERTDGESFALFEDEDGGWQMEPAVDRAVKRGVVTRHRNGLASLAGTGIAAAGVADADKLALYGLDTPAVEVEVTLRDGTSCGRAMAGVVDPDSEEPAYYFKRVGDDIVMTAPQYLFSRMDALPDDFLAAKP